MGVRAPRLKKTRAHERREIELLSKRAPLYLTKLQCEFCGRAFMTEDALTRHIERKHPEVLHCRAS